MKTVLLVGERPKLVLSRSIALAIWYFYGAEFSASKVTVTQVCAIVLHRHGVPTVAPPACRRHDGFECGLCGGGLSAMLSYHSEYFLGVIPFNPCPNPCQLSLFCRWLMT